MADDYATNGDWATNDDWEGLTVGGTAIAALLMGVGLIAILAVVLAVV